MKLRSIFTVVVAALALAAIAATQSRTTAATKTASPVASNPLVIDGIDVPRKMNVSGETLQLNGAGIRTVKIALIPVKAYVAAFYTPEPLRSEKAVLASAGPFVFDFKFLGGVSKKKVNKAWAAQFKESCTHRYAGYEKDLDKFVKLFGSLEKGEIQRIVIEGGATRAYEGDILKGSIDGRGFQEAFLSLWFGKKPVMASLQTELLGM